VGRQDTIEIEVHSSTASVVTLRGEHDLNSVARIDATLTAASVRGKVLVDLSNCAFIDSTVISALLRASNRLHARGGLLSLVIPSGEHQAIRSIFELMSIERLLPTHATREAAIAHLESDSMHTASAPRTRLRALSEIIDASFLDVSGEAEEHRRAA
jgi:anti-anti-sigma factor